MGLRNTLAVAMIKGLGALPLPMSRAIGRGFGYLAWLGNGRGKQTTLRNLELCFPDMPVNERLALAKRSLQETSITGAEVGYIWTRPYDEWKDLIEVPQASHEVVQEALAKNKGLLVLGPHLGNWEVIGLYFAEVYGITSMYEPIKYKGVDKIVHQARERTGASLVPTNTSGVKAQLKALKQGKLVGVLPDQVPDRNSGQMAPFFGIPALTMGLIHSMASRTGAAAITVYAERTDKGFKLIFSHADERIYSKDSLEALTGLNASVEACVRQRPEQYQWEYKRFRRQTDGVDFYK